MVIIYLIVGILFGMCSFYTLLRILDKIQERADCELVRLKAEHKLMDEMVKRWREVYTNKKQNEKEDNQNETCD